MSGALTVLVPLWLTAIAGALVVVIYAFKTSRGQGLLSLFVPLYLYYFLFWRMRRTAKGWIIGMVTAAPVASVGVGLVYLGMYVERAKDVASGRLCALELARDLGDATEQAQGFDGTPRWCTTRSGLSSPHPGSDSAHLMAFGHPQRGHRIQGSASNSGFYPLPLQRAASHRPPDDALVAEDRVLHQAPPAVAGLGVPVLREYPIRRETEAISGWSSMAQPSAFSSPYWSGSCAAFSHRAALSPLRTSPFDNSSRPTLGFRNGPG